MKRALAIIVVGFLFLCSIATMASAQNPVIRTSKVMYLLDPYYWVYSAARYRYPGPAQENPGFWSEEGHSVLIEFSLYGYDKEDPQTLIFNVEGLIYPKGGTLEEDPPGSRIYKGQFEVSEADVGGELFKPGELDPDTQKPMVPKELVLTISEETGDEPVLVAQRNIYINRWGCDRCHLAKEIATEVYPWCEPTGGPFGPHYWGNILGRNDGRPGFTYANLTDVTLTHTPTVGSIVNGEYVKNPLDRPPYHQKTNVKQAGNKACSPCHQGYDGTVRTPSWKTGPDPQDQRGKCLTVKCTFCHGIDGGYVPDSTARPRWEDWYMNSWQ